MFCEVDQPRSTCSNLSSTSVCELPLERLVDGSFAVWVYADVRELRRIFEELDHPACGLAQTIVLVLPETFQGFLPGIIRRHHPALRLLIVTNDQHLPGVPTSGDLEMTAADYGFHLISFYSELEPALSTARKPLAHNEHCTFVLPAG